MRNSEFLTVAKESIFPGVHRIDRHSEYSRRPFHPGIRALVCLFVLVLAAAAQSNISVAPTIVPGALAGSAYAQTLAAIGTAPITWSVTSGTFPLGLSLGSSTGLISGTPSATGVFTFTVTAANAGGSNSEQLTLTVNAPPTPPTITTASPMPTAVTGSVYTQTLVATGTGPIIWSVTSGALPAGLTLGSSTGVIGGTPTAAGIFTPTITATNAGGSNSKLLSLTVNAPPVIVTTSLPAAVTGSVYTETLAVTGTAPITWSVTGGALPTGLSLGSSTGIISGTASAAGVFTPTITATNAGGSNSKLLSLTVNAPPVIATTSLPAAVSGSVYTQTLAATGTAPITWSVTRGALPTGLSLGTSTGVISGTPTATGVFTPTITATNAGGSNSQQVSLTVNAPVTVVLTPPSVSLLPLQSQTFTVTVGGTSNTGVTWTLVPSLGTFASNATTFVYVAPSAAATSQTVTVTATSTADPTKSATAAITLLQAVTISLSPSTVSLTPSGTQQFAATVLGTSNTAVTWSMSPALGTITAAGLYAAPASIAGSQTVTVTATSAASASVLASAAVSLSPPVSVTLAPGSVILTQSQTQSFVATVGNASNTAVTWSISPSVGSITSTGVYTAPSSILTSQTVTVTAESVADPTKSASTIVSCIPVTFYVDSVNGTDSNPGTQAAPWRTIAKVNSAKLSPGQSVAFKAGDLWREQLTIWSVGAAGSPITFTSYGSGAAPIISGADLLTSWASTPPYSAPYTTAPTQVFRNGTRLTQVSTQSALVTGTWWLNTAASRIYVYDNPNGNTMEGSQRSYGVQIGGSYVSINGLESTEAANIGVGIFTGSNYVNVTNCDVANSYTNGIALWSATPSMSNGLIQGNTIRTSGSNGIGVSQNATYWTIQDNIIYANSSVPANNAYTAGIDIGNSSVSNITIQNNEVYSNGLAQPTNIGFGIHVDVQSPNNIIRWNTVNGNNDCNILVELSRGNQIYGNVVYGSIQGCGIGVRGASGSPASGNAVYNNTIYGNLANQTWAGGLLIYGDGTPGSFVNNTFENNVSVGNSSPQLNAFGGAENDGTNGYGNVYSHNDFGQDATNFVKWGTSAYYSTLAAWQAASGQGNNLNVNPLLTNPSAADFTLQSGSPAIGAGVYISGVSTSNPPNMGAK